VFDADKDQIRIEVAGSGNVVTFQFGPERAKSFVLNGVTFALRER
jgi:hypothetical protein